MPRPGVGGREEARRRGYLHTPEPPERVPAQVEIFRDADGGSWIVALHWTQIAGRYECVGVECRSFVHGDDPQSLQKEMRPLPAVPQSVMTAAKLRRFPLGRWIDEHRAESRRIWEEAAAAPSYRVRLQQLGVNVDSEVRTWRAGQRRARFDLSATAAVYRDAHAAGDSPTLAVADFFQLSRSAAAKRVQRARRAGLLPETTRGRPRAQPDVDERTTTDPKGDQ